MYKRFTASARKTCQLANQASQRFNHDRIDTLHFLHGLLGVEWGGASVLLTHLMGDVTPVRLAIEEWLGSIPGEEMLCIGKAPQSAQARKAIESAVGQAAQSSLDYIGTEHILLGLMIGVEDPATTVLDRFGIHREAVSDHCWVVQFDTPSPAEALVFLSRWRDDRARYGWVVFADDALREALVLAPGWPGPGGCRLDKSIHLLSEVECHILCQHEKRPNKALHLTGPAVRDIVSLRLSSRPGR